MSGLVGLSVRSSHLYGCELQVKLLKDFQGSEQLLKILGLTTKHMLHNAM